MEQAREFEIPKAGLCEYGYSLVAQHYEQVTEGPPDLEPPAQAVQAQGRGRRPATGFAVLGDHQPCACCNAPPAPGLSRCSSS